MRGEASLVLYASSFDGPDSIYRARVLRVFPTAICDRLVKMKVLENLFRYKWFEVSGTSCISVKAPYQSTSRIKKSDAYKTRQSVPMQLFANIWTIHSGNVWRLNRFFFFSEEFDNFSTRHVLVLCFFFNFKGEGPNCQSCEEKQETQDSRGRLCFFSFWWAMIGRC